MGLSTAEWDAIEEVVKVDLVGVVDPYRTLDNWFPDEVGDMVITQQPSANARYLVNRARSARLTEARPFSLVLLRTLVRLDAVRIRPDFDFVKGCLARLEQAKAEVEQYDPFEAQVLPASGEIFIDRTSSREILRSLVEPPQPHQPQRWLVRIVGDARSGTSYTYAFIQHLSAKEEIRPALVTLDKSSNAEDIVRELSLQLTGKRERASQAADSVKQVRHWASWLAKQACAAADGRRWWLVFDQCNQLDPGSSAVNMIAQLVTAVKQEPVPPEQRARVILLGYGDQLADLDVPRPLRLVDKVERVGEGHLTEFFSRVFQDIDARRVPAVALDPALLNQYVAVAVHQVIGDARAGAAAKDGTCFMDALSEAAYDAIDAYREASPTPDTTEVARDEHAG